jgi:hypothetical protein
MGIPRDGCRRQRLAEIGDALVEIDVPFLDAADHLLLVWDRLWRALLHAKLAAQEEVFRAELIGPVSVTCGMSALTADGRNEVGGCATKSFDTRRETKGSCLRSALGDDAGSISRPTVLGPSVAGWPESQGGGWQAVTRRCERAHRSRKARQRLGVHRTRLSTQFGLV